MTTLTITLSDERVKKLQEIADRFRVAPEELVRAQPRRIVDSSARRFSAGA